MRTICDTRSIATGMGRLTATGLMIVRAALRRPADELLRRIPIGQRTTRDLIISAVPARLIVVMALFALCAAVAISVAAKVLSMIGLTWLGTKAAQYAATFEAMPLWVLIGGSMSQVAARVCVAWDDLAKWLAE